MILGTYPMTSGTSVYIRRIQYKILESLPHNHSYSIIILSSSHSNICQTHTKEVLQSMKQEDVTAWKLNNKTFTDWSTSKNRLHSIFTSLSCFVLQFTMYCRSNTMASIHHRVYIRYSQHLDHAWNYHCECHQTAMPHYLKLARLQKHCLCASSVT